MAEHETDLRQGITPTQHAVLDLIEQRAELWAELGDFDHRLQLAKKFAKTAGNRLGRIRSRRNAALCAAGLLIDAADEMARLLGLGSEAK